MTRRGPDRSRHLTTSSESRNYDIGYGKPPVATRFKPGQSGNPRGRPRGKSSDRPLNEERLKSIILEEAYRTISVNDVKGPIMISMAQAVVRSLAVNAAKGNQRAQRLFTELLAAVERDNKQLHDHWLETAINYKVEWERELERRRKLGIDAPDPIPHPDHVVIDMHAGTVRITGPMTKEEKVVWDLVQEGTPESKEQLAELEKLIARRPNMAIAERLGLAPDIPAAPPVTRIELVAPNYRKSDDVPQSDDTHDGQVTRAGDRRRHDR